MLDLQGNMQLYIKYQRKEHRMIKQIEDTFFYRSNCVSGVRSERIEDVNKLFKVQSRLPRMEGEKRLTFFFTFNLSLRKRKTSHQWWNNPQKKESQGCQGWRGIKDTHFFCTSNLSLRKRKKSHQWRNNPQKKRKSGKPGVEGDKKALHFFCTSK